MAGAVGRGLYMITNRRVIIWVDKKTVRSFAGPMVMNMARSMLDDDLDVGSIAFSHGMDGNPAGSGFICIDKCSEVEELIRGYLIDRVLEKSAAGDGPALIPMDGPNPFKMDDGREERGERKKPKKLELWQAAALALEAEKELSPEMISSAKDHTEKVLEESKLDDATIEKVLDEMQPGEAAVWAGKPNADMLAKKAWFYVYIALGGLGFVLVIFGVIAAMSATIMEGGISWEFMLPLGIMGFLVVCGMVAALLYPTYKRWLATKAFYVLTTRRALTWEPQWFGSVKLEAYGPRDLTNLHVVEDDVVFRTVTTVYRSRKGGTTEVTVRYGFLGQENPHEIEKLVRETLVDPFLDKAYE
jgi:hypothetical protein